MWLPTTTRLWRNILYPGAVTFFCRQFTSKTIWFLKVGPWKIYINDKMPTGGDSSDVSLQDWCRGGKERCCPHIQQHTHWTNLHQVRIETFLKKNLNEYISLLILWQHLVFSSNKQAEAICDVVTCLERDCAVGEVSQRLLGSRIIQYLRDSIPR